MGNLTSADVEERDGFTATFRLNGDSARIFIFARAADSFAQLTVGLEVQLYLFRAVFQASLLRVVR
ncbi:MAG TPA: hypothetical protein VK041_07630 [Opitutales bacterium]|nr:hypothetical protein [Opitutales bacterium]